MQVKALPVQSYYMCERTTYVAYFLCVSAASPRHVFAYWWLRLGLGSHDSCFPCIFSLHRLMMNMIKE